MGLGEILLEGTVTGKKIGTFKVRGGSATGNPTSAVSRDSFETDLKGVSFSSVEFPGKDRFDRAAAAGQFNPNWRQPAHLLAEGNKVELLKAARDKAQGEINELRKKGVSFPDKLECTVRVTSFGGGADPKGDFAIKAIRGGQPKGVRCNED